ncbi:type II restriction enzyme methylase subunits [Clostridium sp. SY8519]|nr:type II restriction enzyme methylase subunits [Clostridium sp. SY8519]
MIFKIKKVCFTIDSRKQSNKEYRSFTQLLFRRFITGAVKGFLLAIVLRILDIQILEFGLNNICDSSMLADVIIGELGVAGVILGLYCSNISSVYSTRYANAPEKIAIAFQYDKLTVTCLNAISGFIIYGTIVLVELLLGYKVGWGSVGILIIWSILVVLSFGITGNRIYQLSDIFRVADDSHILLERVVSKNLKQELYAADTNYQNHFCKISSDKIELLKVIQKYGCNPDLTDNSPVLKFMCTNVGLIERYWNVKRYISKDSYWFRRKGTYQKWHFADDTEASMALRTGTALRPKEEPNYYWFEDELMSINHSCVNYLIKKNDWGTLYSYFAVFESICKTAIEKKEASYYVGQIDWLKNVIKSAVDSTNMKENVAFAGIVEHISLLYLDLILESSKYLHNLNLDAISKSVIEGIDTKKSYDSIKEVRGRDYIDIYKKIITEVYAEGHRITPNWLIKQYVAKEEFVYVNSLFDMIKEGIEHAYSLSRFFIEKNMHYEACIMLTRFYEYESKLLNFYMYANQVEEALNSYHLDSEDKWDGSRLAGVESKFLEYKKELPEMLLKCSSAFAIKNWDRREECPDFLGECYNHIAEDTVDAIVRSDKKQFEKDFENLTKIMLLYQEYIRSDFIKNKDLYRVEYAYYMFTSPIVEWAQIGGLGILWGEFFKDIEWRNIVKKVSKQILIIREKEEKSTEVAAQLIEFISQRDKFLFGIGSRDILETRWNQFVENAIRESAVIETEYALFGEKIKTDSKIITAFCPDFLRAGFSSDPSEVFWIICVNPLLPEEKRFRSRFSLEDDLNE